MRNVLFIERDTYWMNPLGSQFMLKPDYRIDHALTFVEGMNKLQHNGPQYHSVIVSENTIFSNEPEHSIVMNLKASNPMIQVIIVLENNSPQKYVNFIQGGAHAVLSKPYSIDAICAEFEKPVSFQNSFAKSNEVKVGGLHELGENTAPIHEFNPAPFDPNRSNLPPNHEFAPNGGYTPAPNHVPHPNTGGYAPMGGYPPAGGGYAPAPNQYGAPNPYNAPAPNGGYDPNYGQPLNGYNPVPPTQPYIAPQPAFAPQGGFEQPYGQGYPEQNQQQGQGGIVRIRDKTIIAVHSPKGGVGKSTISKELATTYAMSSLNGNKLKVCLVDMDIENGDIATLLDLKSTKTITEWADNIRHRMTPNGAPISYSYEEIEKYFLLDHPTGLKVLAAPIAHKDVSKINEDIVEIIYENLKKYFDIIVVDTGPNIRDFTIVSLEKADNVLLISDTDVTTINEVAVLRKTLEQMHYPMNKIGMVINNVPPKNQSALNDIVNFLRFPLIGAITRSSVIEDSNNRGIIMVTGKDTTFTIEIKKIAHSLIPIIRRETSLKGAPTKKQSSPNESKSILKRIFKK